MNISNSPHDSIVEVMCKQRYFIGILPGFKGLGLFNSKF